MSKYVSLASVLLALVTFAGGAAQAADPPVAIAKIDHVSIRPDPAIRRGVLPNGLRYLVMRNANPAGAVSLRLGLDVGSYEEADAERGSAHFVEHMAFRSTRSFPDGALERVFAPWGVAFGRDQNAATTLFSTVYQLDIPKPDQAQLKSGFGWLRDVADGIEFTDDAVARERGVVLAEMEVRNSPLATAQEAVTLFQAGAQRSLNRLPIGLKTTLDAATAKSLKRFYDSWYRPEHAVVTVVGDLPVDEMEAMIRSGFSTWTARGPKPTRAPIVQPAPGRGQDSFNVTGPALPTALSACRIRSGGPVGLDGVPRLREVAQSQIWQEVLNKRLARRAADGDTQLLGAMIVSSDNRDLAATCLAVVPIGESWESALRVAQAELNRFANDGSTEIEAETAVELLRSRLRGGVLAVGSRRSSALADDLLSRTLTSEVISSPADMLYAFNLAVEDMTPADLKARFAADWSGSAPLIAMTGPKPVSRQALLTAWAQGVEAGAQERFVDRVTAAWGYKGFGKPGRVVERTLIADPGFTRLRFANGLIFDFKQTKLEPNKVDIRLHFGAGRHEIDDGQYIAAELGTSMLIEGGVGKHSFEDIQTIFASKTSWNFDLGMGPRTFAVRAGAFTDGVESQLQILGAYMSDPGFRPSLDARIPTAVDLIYRAFMTQPAAALNVAMEEALAPGSPGNLPSREVMAKLNSADFKRVLGPVLTTAPIELTIVGDIDEASAVKAVAATFGALPARSLARRDRVAPRFMRYPDTAGPPIRIEHDGAADQAAAALIWPLYVSTPARRSEEYALKLLAAVFDTALRRRVREELGKTYAPSVSTMGPDFGDQGVLEVSINAAPRDIEALVVEARAVAARLVAGEITVQMLDDARQPILASVRARRSVNGWWADAMGGSAQNPAVLEESLKFEPLMSAITVADLRAAAAKWLTRPPIVGLAYPRGSATGAEQ